MDPPCGEPILWGISPDFSGLSPCYRWIAYVLLTRAPVADRGIATSSLPLDLHVLGLSLAFILSQDQTLRCIFFFFFIIPSKRYLTELTSFSLLLLYYTCFFNSFNELLSNGGPVASPFCESAAKILPFSIIIQIFSNVFFELFLNKI